MFDVLRWANIQTMNIQFRNTLLRRYPIATIESLDTHPLRVNKTKKMTKSNNIDKKEQSAFESILLSQLMRKNLNKPASSEYKCNT